MNRPTLNFGPSGCISAEELIRYREGRLTEERLNYVRSHLKVCLSCLDALLHVRDMGESEAFEVPSDLITTINRVAREVREKDVKKRGTAARAATS
jgi:hypothetical protein